MKPTSFNEMLEFENPFFYICREKKKSVHHDTKFVALQNERA